MPNVETAWNYTPDEASDQVQSTDNLQGDKTDQPKADSANFSWTAASSPMQKKRFSWYIYLTIITLGLAELVLFFTKDKISTAVIVICGILFGIYGARKPKPVSYRINDVSFTIASKRYEFTKFKSFSLLKSGDHLTAALTPLKRFMPYLYINFSKADEGKITPILSQKLPVENSKGDIVERFTRYVGF